MFRLSWTGDYPDAENFMQLFYGPNSGASNRVCCDLQEINRMYEKIKTMQPSAERDQAYEELAELIRSKCPWIFESFTVSFMLKHCWLENMQPHDFAFQRWKYISVDSKKRDQVKASFTPLSLGELRGK
jgi:ABC-type oligopeptide transport system substrate-binding subunit